MITVSYRFTAGSLCISGVAINKPIVPRLVPRLTIHHPGRGPVNRHRGDMAGALCENGIIVSQPSQSTY